MLVNERVSIGISGEEVKSPGFSTSKGDTYEKDRTINDGNLTLSYGSEAGGIEFHTKIAGNNGIVTPICIYGRHHTYIQI